VTDRPVYLRMDKPHSARMYDYYLGGKDNYEVDRLAVAEVERNFPTTRLAARANRDFMHRATRFVAEQGVRQFLDIGTGIPTEPNLHQLAQSVIPQAKVVYVDNDPIVLVHAKALMVSAPEGRTAFVPGDVTAPETILSAPQLLDILDLTQPVALSLVALMHFVVNERAYDIVKTLVGALAPGSYLVMSNATADNDPEGIAEVVRVYGDGGLTLVPRTRDEFSRFFGSHELIDPGVVLLHRWRPSVRLPPSMDSQINLYGAVARI